MAGAKRIMLWSVALAGCAGVVLVALHVVRRQIVARPEYTVRPEVTRLESVPSWLDEAGAKALIEEVESSLGGSFQVFDAGPVLAAGVKLEAMGVVRGFRADRMLPSQVRLTLDLPRPIVFYQQSDGASVCLDLEGRPIPLPIDPSRLRLPELTGLSPDPANREREARNGAAVAWEVQTRFLPALEPGLSLTAVDLSNHDYRLLADGSRGEIRLVLTGPQDNSVVLEWDRRPDNKFPPLPVEQKIAVAQKILERHPGFAGVLAADLRFQHRWEQWATYAPVPPAER